MKSPLRNRMITEQNEGGAIMIFFNCRGGLTGRIDHHRQPSANVPKPPKVGQIPLHKAGVSPPTKVPRPPQASSSSASEGIPAPWRVAMPQDEASPPPRSACASIGYTAPPVEDEVEVRQTPYPWSPGAPAPDGQGMQRGTAGGKHRGRGGTARRAWCPYKSPALQL